MSNLYFGPYNDPGDTQTLHHWDLNHDPDCHNAAFTVDRNGQLLNISLAVRNRGTVASPSDLVVTLYAAACGLFGAVTDVNALVDRVILNGRQNPAENPDNISTYLEQWSSAKGNTPVVPPFNAAIDTPWNGSKPWAIPAYSNSVVLVATLSTANGEQGPTGTCTQDPCVAVWLG